MAEIPTQLELIAEWRELSKKLRADYEVASHREDAAYAWAKHLVFRHCADQLEKALGITHG